MRRYLLATFACSLGVLVAVACGTDDGGSTFDNNGGDSGSDGSSSGNPNFGDTGIGDNGDGSDDNPNATGVLTAVIRDFRKWNGDAASTNPDFEDITPTLLGLAGDQTGLSEATNGYGPYFSPSADASVTSRFTLDIVQPDLDDAGIPVYTTKVFEAGAPNTMTTHGKSFFDQWYRDTPGMNIRKEVAITLTPTGTGAFSYDSAQVGVALADAAAAGDDPLRKEFFPIDDRSDASTAFGNEGDAHNYSFTVELRTTFKYKGTETFTFSGDDDVFVFINHKLVINIGGVHEAFTKTINVADFAASAGLTVGGTYSLDFFQAERHKTESNLRIETTLDLKAPIILK